MPAALLRLLVSALPLLPHSDTTSALILSSTDTSACCPSMLQGVKLFNAGSSGGVAAAVLHGASSAAAGTLDFFLLEAFERERSSMWWVAVDCAAMRWRWRCAALQARQ